MRRPSAAAERKVESIFVMREKGKHTAAGAMIVACAAGAVFPCLCTAQSIEFDALDLLSMPQPTFDIAQARPNLTLHRAEVGAINSLAQLTGQGDAGDDELNQNARPFFYHHAAGTVANLGDLTDDFADPAAPPLNGRSKGLGLNDLGWVVGVSSTAAGTGIADDRPFLWLDDDANHANTPGEMRSLTINPGATRGSAARVNNAGQVLINGDSGLYRGDFSLNAGALSEPGPRLLIAPAADIADMNEAGDVAYILGNAGFVWRDIDNDDQADPNETTQIPFMSTNPLWQTAQVFAINNVGQAVGTMRNDHGRFVGFLWSDLDQDNLFDFNDTNTNGIFEASETSDEVIRFHGDPAGINATLGNTFARDLNDQGQVVGGFDDSTIRDAFIFDAINGMRSLNGLIDFSFPLLMSQGEAINNAGQIAVLGKDFSGTTDHLVLLSPLTIPIEGDLNSDGFVGIEDLNVVLGNWNQNVPPGELTSGDPSNDGFVGIEDLNVVLGNWNAGSPPLDEALSLVPEPSTAVIGLVLVFLGLDRHRGVKCQQPQLKVRHMTISKLLTWALLVVLATSPATIASPFNQIVGFGDSLSDTGNANARLGVAGQGYFDGRFSNGPVWIEYLAIQLQLDPPVANLESSAGRNYAFGGARTDGSGLVSLFINDIDEQVPDYLNNDGGPSGDELIVVWGGANDFLDGQTNTSVPVANLASDITDLHAAGGRRFMVVNLPLLGKTPRFVGTSNEAVFDALSSQFNAQLSLSLDNLEGTLADIEFFRIDAGAMIEDATLNPATYGFTNVTDEAMGLGGIDPDEYLFWDDVHPTTAAHELIAQIAADVLFDALSALTGDLDFDGFVGIEDLNRVLSNWNANVSPGNPLFGDPSGDGFVGIEDVNVVLGNWNAGTPPTVAIPEPSTLMLLGVGLGGLLRRSRRATD